jgi:hypothetical protein
METTKIAALWAWMMKGSVGAARAVRGAMSKPPNMMITTASGLWRSIDRMASSYLGIRLHCQGGRTGVSYGGINRMLSKAVNPCDAYRDRRGGHVVEIGILDANVTFKDWVSQGETEGAEGTFEVPALGRLEITKLQGEEGKKARLKRFLSPCASRGQQAASYFRSEVSEGTISKASSSP